MDIGTVLLYGLPATVVLFVIVFKFIFTSNEKGRNVDSNESPTNKKEKKNTKVITSNIVYLLSSNNM